MKAIRLANQTLINHTVDRPGFWTHFLLLYIDLRPGQTCHSKVMHQREWHIPMASNRKKSRKQIWLTKWDKVKAHGTLIDWYTRREWPLNCMTVISTWWRSKMPFQRLSGWLSGRLNYYITLWRQEVSELEIRWVGDKLWEGQPPPSRRGPLDPQWSLGTRPVGDKMQ